MSLCAGVWAWQGDRFVGCGSGSEAVSHSLSRVSKVTLGTLAARLRSCCRVAVCWCCGSQVVDESCQAVADLERDAGIGLRSLLGQNDDIAWLALFKVLAHVGTIPGVHCDPDLAKLCPVMELILVSHSCDAAARQRHSLLGKHCQGKGDQLHGAAEPSMNIAVANGKNVSVAMDDASVDAQTGSNNLAELVRAKC